MEENLEERRPFQPEIIEELPEEEEKKDNSLEAAKQKKNIARELSASKSASIASNQAVASRNMENMQLNEGSSLVS